MDDVALSTLLREMGVEYELIALECPTRTAAEAADALGVTTAQVVKSLVCMADGSPVLALIPGDRSLAFARLSAAAGARTVALARGPVVEEVSGYAVGAVAPIGHPRPMRTFIDTTLRDVEVAYFGGGSHRHMLRLAVVDLERLTDLEWVDLTEPPEEPATGTTAPDRPPDGSTTGATGATE